MMIYVYAFLAGGAVTVAIAFFEVLGISRLSGFFAIMPISTWVSYLFIGELEGPQVVSRHALFVILGTLVAWMPYMLAIYLLAPRIGTNRAILVALIIFGLLAMAFLRFYRLPLGTG